MVFEMDRNSVYAIVQKLKFAKVDVHNKNHGYKDNSG
jgi:hypothetical protein